MKISIFSGQIISLRVATLSPPPPKVKRKRQNVSPRLRFTVYKRCRETGFQSSENYLPMNSTRQLTANPVIAFTTDGQLHYSNKNGLQIWLTFLFAFISVKHNKLQMIHGSYHIRQESSAKQSLSPEGQHNQS